MTPFPDNPLEPGKFENVYGKGPQRFYRLPIVSARFFECCPRLRWVRKSPDRVLLRGRFTIDAQFTLGQDRNKMDAD
jgi:hypothetical protein